MPIMVLCKSHLQSINHVQFINTNDIKFSVGGSEGKF